MANGTYPDIYATGQTRGLSLTQGKWKSNLPPGLVPEDMAGMMGLKQTVDKI
jgi:hypothetical protein